MNKMVVTCNKIKWMWNTVINSKMSLDNLVQYIQCMKFIKFEVCQVWSSVRVKCDFKPYFFIHREFLTYQLSGKRGSDYAI